MRINDALDAAACAPRYVTLWLLLGGAWLGGCAGQTSVKSAWQENAPRNQSFSRVLVVGLTPDYNQRCHFEFSLVSQLKRTITAVPSCDLIKSQEPLTRESVERAVATIGADAVLTTSLAEFDFGTKEGAGRDSRGGGYYKATDVGYATSAYGGYAVMVVYADYVASPSITTVHGKARLVTRLYETHTGSLVYTLDTKANELESREAALLEITPAIADRLRRDGLIR